MGKNGLNIRDEMATDRRLVISLPVEENGVDEVVGDNAIVTDFLHAEARIVGVVDDIISVAVILVVDRVVAKVGKMLSWGLPREAKWVVPISSSSKGEDN